MEVIVLDDDSDEGDHSSKAGKISANHVAEGCSPPAKRRRQEPLSNGVSDTRNTGDLLSVGVSHISDTAQEPSMTEAPLQPGSAAADDASSPTLSPQQVRTETMPFLDCSLPWCAEQCSTPTAAARSRRSCQRRQECLLHRKRRNRCNVLAAHPVFLVDFCSFFTGAGGDSSRVTCQHFLTVHLMHSQESRFC